jgi:VanZ family protein
MTSRVIPAFAWTCLLLVACLIPGGWLRVNESGYHLGISHVDKLVHCALFAGFSILWIRSARSRRGQLCVFVAGLILAVLTELGQSLPIIGRDSDPLDALADVVGLVLGFGAAYALNERSKAQEARAIAEAGEACSG